ncbi:alpha/beta fold hydrolase [Streptomyces mangrovisoli]|uniref:Alpha/beta hydrolase n=1 Tax=Streptomyces mangrovisoli TaxID=1428628 RepID=A0A1J4NZX8_9ACTN|nr:alpha/beta hydrolase [Streptomyces mangrovisoli]OIJ68041.1 alpha/beta hydrolase [Streptomyces mangrovisoli]
MTRHAPRPTGPAAADLPPAALVPRRRPRTSRAPRSAVLFLHGGTADSRVPANPWQLSALRIRPLVRAVAAVTPDDVLVAQVRYRVRGWNGADADPLHDAHRALDELGRRFGDLPTVLVGHSMGGRAALRAADTPRVSGVLALAPWCPDGEPVDHLAGKDVVVLHGDRDRVTDPAASLALVARARAAGARAEAVVVPGGDHALLRPLRYWHRAAGESVGALLARQDPRSYDTGPPR